MTAPHPARHKARLAGDHYYHGAACKDCHGTLRNTQNANCVQCHNNGDKSELQKKMKYERFLQAMAGVQYDR